MEPHQQPVEPTLGSAVESASTVDIEAQLGRVEAAVERSEPRHQTAGLATPTASIAVSERAPRSRTAVARRRSMRCWTAWRAGWNGS